LAKPDDLPSTDSPGLARGTGQGYYGDEPGGRKRVNTRFNDISGLVTSSVTGNGANSPTVLLQRAPNGPPFSGDIALVLRKLPSSAKLNTPNFTNGCSKVNLTDTIPKVPTPGSILNNLYVQLTDQQVGALNRGSTVPLPLDFYVGFNHLGPGM